jgi:hypothetical protein
MSYINNSYNWNKVKIVDVFNENLTDELRKISDLIDDYSYIAMVRK